MAKHKYNAMKSVAALGMALCVAQPSLADSSSDQLEQVLAQTEAALAEVRNHGNAWNSTEKLMNSAREALQAGDKDDALELARRALLTATMAGEQGRLEQDAWRDRVPKPGQ